MRPSDYKTKQKQAILNLLKENCKRHMTAADIIDRIKNSENGIGTATVYRYLDKLVAKGVIRKYVIDDKAGACYQYIENNESCSEHFHLKCIECGKLFHLDCSHLKSISEHIRSDHGFLVDNSRTVFYGLCEKCSSCASER